MILDRLALSRNDLDRAGERRADDAWLARAWADPRTRVLVIAGGQALVRYDGPSPRLRLLASAEAPAGERYFLGLAQGDHGGQGSAGSDGPGAGSAGADAPAYFAVATDQLPEGRGEDTTAANLRDVGALLDDREAGMLVHAVALANWHAAHEHCARCGAPTVVAGAGHLRRCTVEGSEHYPRTDPAVIMAVVDAQDRILLGHSPRWPARRFSTLAGFVEPGESLEAAVRREVLEESAIVVGAVDYLGSQPWPFPSSLMLGFRATADTTAISVDGDELGEARWFSREELSAAVREHEVLLPPPVSIARRLIEQWYGSALSTP